LLHLRKRNHWITVHYDGQGSFEVWDSRHEENKLKFEERQRLKSIVPKAEQGQRKIVVSFVRCRQQPQSADDAIMSGFFSLAHVVQILLKDKPSGFEFDVDKMREHTMRILATEQLEPFPSTANQVASCSKNTNSMCPFYFCHHAYSF
jgi:hypothetical protein